jgi:hypothetical protein
MSGAAAHPDLAYLLGPLSSSVHGRQLLNLRSSYLEVTSLLELVVLAGRKSQSAPTPTEQGAERGTGFWTGEDVWNIKTPHDLLSMLDLIKGAEPTLEFAFRMTDLFNVVFIIGPISSHNCVDRLGVGEVVCLQHVDEKMDGSAARKSKGKTWSSASRYRL